jgi:hypothetical protein
MMRQRLGMPKAKARVSELLLEQVRARMRGRAKVKETVWSLRGKLKETGKQCLKGLASETLDYIDPAGYSGYLDL